MKLFMLKKLNIWVSFVNTVTSDIIANGVFPSATFIVCEKKTISEPKTIFFSV